APVHAVQGNTKRLAGSPGQVCVRQNIVIEPVLCEDVGGQVRIVVPPVVRKLLGAKYEDGSVAEFVVFDDGERGEGLAESHAVREDAPVVCFELVDDASRRVLLIVEELVPDYAVAVPGE